MQKVTLVIKGKNIVAVSNAIELTNNYVEFLFNTPSTQCKNTKVEFKNDALYVYFDWDGIEADFVVVSQGCTKIENFGVTVEKPQSFTSFLTDVDYRRQEARLGVWYTEALRPIEEDEIIKEYRKYIVDLRKDRITTYNIPGGNNDNENA